MAFSAVGTWAVWKDWFFQQSRPIAVRECLEQSVVSCRTCTKRTRHQRPIRTQTNPKLSVLSHPCLKTPSLAGICRLFLSPNSLPKLTALPAVSKVKNCGKKDLFSPQARWGDDGARQGMKHVTTPKRVNIAIRQPPPESPVVCMGSAKVRPPSITISTLTRNAVRSYWQPHKVRLEVYL